MSDLDTSGAVKRNGGTMYDVDSGYYTWSELTPFTQGYIESLFAGLVGAGDKFAALPNPNGKGHTIGLAFSDLAPKTLAWIIADCARKVEIVGPPILRDGVDVFWTAERGGRFWMERQADECGENFPPLTVQLGDDGKVRFAQ